MAIKHLINAGCSFAHGYGSTPLTTEEYKIIKQPGLDKISNSRYVGQLGSPIENGNWSGGYASQGYYITKKFNLSYNDLARNGNSNESIQRNLKDYLVDKKNKEEHIVLIGWTHAFRREYISWNKDKQKGEWTQYREIPKPGSRFFNSFLLRFTRANTLGKTMVTFNERDNRPISFEDHSEYRKYNIILDTQRLLESWNVPYIMYNGCGAENESTMPAVLDLKKRIKKENFYMFESSIDQLLKDHPNWKFRDGHPNNEFHKKMSNNMSPMFQKLLTNN
jgi:hypothetical protein